MLMMLALLSLGQALTPTPRATTTHLSAGAVAPFDGMLLPGAAALSLAQRASGCEQRAALEQQRSQAMLAMHVQQSASLQAALSTSEAESRRCDAVLQRTQVEAMADRQGVRPWMWLGVGAALGAGVALAIVVPHMPSHDASAL